MANDNQRDTDTRSKASKRGPGPNQPQRDPKAHLRPDRGARVGGTDEADLEGKANPTKPQQVHDQNVNRA